MTATRAEGARVPKPPRSERRAPPRDQATTTFTEILERLLVASPGTQAAALVDAEGETVDYAGKVDTFDLKVAAAHWQIVLTGLAEEGPGLGTIRQIQVRARGKSYLVRQQPDRYAVVLILHRTAAFAPSERALAEADERLAGEAGWPKPPVLSPWHSVSVQTLPTERARPVRLKVAQRWQPVEVMGTLVGLAPRERGFRVRLPSGAEMMLLRERLGSWFADERLD